MRGQMAVKTVIVWYRPMPALPAMMLGPNGEQRASPLVVTAGGHRAGLSRPSDAVPAAHGRPHAGVLRRQAPKTIQPASKGLSHDDAPR